MVARHNAIQLANLPAEGAVKATSSWIVFALGLAGLGLIAFVALLLLRQNHPEARPSTTAAATPR